MKEPYIFKCATTSNRRINKSNARHRKKERIGEYQEVYFTFTVTCTDAENLTTLVAFTKGLSTFSELNNFKCWIDVHPTGYTGSITRIKNKWLVPPKKKDAGAMRQRDESVTHRLLIKKGLLSIVSAIFSDQYKLKMSYFYPAN